MTTLLVPKTSEPETSFWDSFDPIVPEAVRCRFFATAMHMAVARATECGRESGPYLHAIKNRHRPRAMLRLATLTSLAGVLPEFFADDDKQLAKTEGAIAEVTHIVSRFQQELVDPLEEAETRGDEDFAKALLKRLPEVAKQIASSAEERFLLSANELEGAVSRTVMLDSGLKPKAMSVVSLDLAQYGRHSSTLDNYGDCEAVFHFNRRIRNGIERTIESLGVTRDRVLSIDTGDGALVMFLSANGTFDSVAKSSFVFTESFLQAFHAANSSVTDSDQHLHFRVGISTGMVALAVSSVRKSPVKECHIGGVTIGRAVRLQSAARTGEVILCNNTLTHLDQLTQARFDGSEEQVRGKVHEKSAITAYRLVLVPPAPEERSSPEEGHLRD